MVDYPSDVKCNNKSMELKDNLYNQIESLSEKGNEAMENERYDEAISFFQQACNLLPAPKEEWEAYT